MAFCDKVKDIKARRDCRSPRTCHNCHQRHHQCICSALSAEAEPFVPQPNETVTTDPKDITSTSLSNNTNTQQFKGGVLLQTAQAIPSDKTCKQQTLVRVLFGCGSQRSYVTESLCDKLGLSPVWSERLHLNTFGDVQHRARNCKLFKVCLCKPGCPDKTEILALSFPVLCSTLPPV